MKLEDTVCRDRLGLLIMRTAILIRRQADSNLYMNEVNKVTGANGWILGYLGEREDQEVYQKDIEEHFKVTRSTVSKVLKKMEEKGMLRRESVSNDARLKRLVLTEKGRMINQQSRVEQEKLERRVREGLSDDDIETLERLLIRVMSNFE